MSRTSTFLERLHAAARANDSWLCVGLDPDPALAPVAFRGADPADWVPRFLGGIIEATSDLVCCYKPNLAFFEALGLAGQQALRQVLKQIPSRIPTLADAKRGDFPPSTRAYARAIFDDLGFDASTVNPYQGGDALAPFFAYPDRGVFVLCKTSNPGSVEIQDVEVRGPDGQVEPLYLRVARLAQAWDQHGTLGLVMGATFPADVAAVRASAPTVPILLPGIGAQAGDLAAAVRAGVDARGERAIVNASRSILYASAADDWADAARSEARRLREAINAARTPPSAVVR